MWWKCPTNSSLVFIGLKSNWLTLCHIVLISNSSRLHLFSIHIFYECIRIATICYLLLFGIRLLKLHLEYNNKQSWNYPCNYTYRIQIISLHLQDNWRAWCNNLISPRNVKLRKTLSKYKLYQCGRKCGCKYKEYLKILRSNILPFCLWQC